MKFFVIVITVSLIQSYVFSNDNDKRKICHLNPNNNKLKCSDLNMKHECGSYLCAQNEKQCKSIKLNRLSLPNIRECLTNEEILFSKNKKMGEKPFYGDDVCKNCIDWPNYADLDGIKLKYKYSNIKIECKYDKCSQSDMKVNIFDCGHYCTSNEKACIRLKSWWGLSTSFYSFKNC